METEAVAPPVELPQPERIAFELRLEDPADIARLQRSPVLAAMRDGRSRGRAVQLIWHDTALGELARDGKALVQVPGRRPVWELHQTLPEATWPARPGQLVPPLADAPQQDALELSVRDPLVPIAAFDGRRQDVKLSNGLELSLMSGELRAVAARKPVARAIITGEALPVHEFALRLAGDIALLPVGPDLAEEARALAHGTAIRPRRLGAPQLPPGLNVGDAFAFIIGHLAEVMLHWLPLARSGSTPEGVHQMRVALRRLRSALKVFGKALGCAEIIDLDQRLKALANALGPARDWDVFLAGAGADLTAVLPEKPILSLVASARQQRATAYRELARVLDGSTLRQTVITAATVAATRPWPAEPAAEDIEVFAARTLHRRHKRMLAHGRDIASWPDEELHALRLDGKRLRYAAEFFAPLFGGHSTKRFLKRLSALQETLGIVNDGAVAGDLVAGLAQRGSSQAFAAGALRGLVAGRAALARRDAVAAWEAFLDRKPFWH